MSRVIKGQVALLFALLTALVLTLAACGGGSSSTSGGGAAGGGSTVAGTVDNGSAAVYPSGSDQPLLAALGDMLLEPAQAAGVPNVTVQLLNSDGEVVDSQVTGDDGEFMFTNLDPDNYTINLQSADGTFLGQAPVQVDSNTRTEIEMDLNGEITSMSVEVEAEGDTISGTVEDDASSDDDDSSGDGASEDNDSVDDESADDEAADDDSGGDDTDDGDSGGDDGSTS